MNVSANPETLNFYKFQICAAFLLFVNGIHKTLQTSQPPGKDKTINSEHEKDEKMQHLGCICICLCGSCVPHLWFAHTDIE